MSDVTTEQAMITIYRAKHPFDYDGNTIKAGEQWTPKGLRNDKQIQEHLCYPVQIALSDLLKGQNSVESNAGAEPKKTGATKKTTTRRRGRKAQSNV